MVYSIDKLDGGVVSLIADRVELIHDSEQDIAVKFLKLIMDTTTVDNKLRPCATFGYELVGCYYLSNIIGFREVAGVTEEQLMQMYKDEVIAMNGDGEYCAKDDNGGDVEVVF